MKTSFTKVGLIVAVVAMTTGFTSCKKKGCTDPTFESLRKKLDETLKNI